MGVDRLLPASHDSVGGYALVVQEKTADNSLDGFSGERLTVGAEQGAFG